MSITAKDREIVNAIDEMSEYRKVEPGDGTCQKVEKELRKLNYDSLVLFANDINRSKALLDIASDELERRDKPYLKEYLRQKLLDKDGSVLPGKLKALLKAEEKVKKTVG